MSISSRWAIRFFAALIALAAALPAAAGTGKWTQLGDNAGHTGYNPAETIIMAKNVAKLANIGNFVTNGVTYQPMAANGVLYVRSTDQNLYAWNVASGKLAWSISLPTIDGPNGLAIGSGTLVANCGFNVGSGICAYSAASGAPVWAYGLQNGGSFTLPTIDGNTVYLGQSGMSGNFNADNIVAVNLKTGAQRWAFGCPDNACATFAAAALAVDGGLVYVGCSSAGGSVLTVIGICALSATSGSLVWQTQLGLVGHGDGAGRLIAHGGTVYAVYQTAVCYQCGYTINVTALNGATGATLWDTPLTGQLNQSYYPIGSPALGADGSVYQVISTSNNPNQPNLFALNPSGTLRWSASTLQSLADPASIVGKKKQAVLFFGCTSGGSSGSTCAFRAQTGAFLWESTDGFDAGEFSPVVTGGRVFNSCNDNDICEYQGK